MASGELSHGLPPKVTYSELTGKQQEIYNFQKVAALLAEHGFNCIKLADDWQGADFLAYHKDGADTLKVQLKGRLGIDKKYVGKDIHMAFKIGEAWYVVRHELLVDLLREHTNALNTPSWIDKGNYTWPTPSAALVALLEPFRLGVVRSE